MAQQTGKRKQNVGGRKTKGIDKPTSKGVPAPKNL
jgi:hypothetical protein